MNTLSSEQRPSGAVASHPPDPHPIGRVALADRIALRIGVALIAWGRRSRVAPLSRERVANRVEQRLAALAREAKWERDRVLG